MHASTFAAVEQAIGQVRRWEECYSSQPPLWAEENFIYRQQAYAEDAIYEDRLVRRPRSRRQSLDADNEIMETKRQQKKKTFWQAFRTKMVGRDKNNTAQLSKDSEGALMSKGERQATIFFSNVTEMGNGTREHIIKLCHDVNLSGVVGKTRP